MAGFGLNNLPYGVFTIDGRSPRLATRLDDMVIDLAALASDGHLPAILAAPSLDGLLEAGRPAWDESRAALIELLSDESNTETVARASHAIYKVDLHLPFTVGDYVDFYSSENHARNIGQIFRPDAEPLLPNWKHMPIGYHGRSSTVVVSGTSVQRPNGQRRGPDGPVFGPSTRLDIELEMGFVVGGANEMGRAIDIADAGDHIFGMVILNDWSARDIQAWEYQPLGPFLGKSFASSISPWVVPMAALEPFRVGGPAQEPEPLDYLRTDEPWAIDIDLSVHIATRAMREGGAKPDVISVTNFKGMYWTIAQQLAHLTVNGAIARPGDFCGSGTISGPAEGTFGSLIELTWNGENPITLSNGESRTFLEDGDEVTLGAVAGSGAGAVSFGEVVGVIEG